VLFRTRLPISSKSGHLRRSNNVIQFHECRPPGMQTLTLIWRREWSERMANIHGWDITTSGLEKTNVCLIEIFLHCDFDQIAVINVLFWSISQFGPSAAEYWVVCNFKMATAVAQYYFRFCIECRYTLPKFKVYLQTKFYRHISIYSWDITTSGLKKTNVRHIEILLLAILTRPQ